MTTLETIANAIEEEYPRVKRIREVFHRHPELSFQEKETFAYVKQELDALGIEYKECVGQYGLAARIKGDPSMKAIGFRADMDALPIQEEAGAPYSSEYPGVMHACGHDGHTAVLLGMASIFKKHPEIMKGDAILFFQPAEESPPGGAINMVEQGMANDVDRVFALHFQGHTPTGVIKTAPGRIMASSDSITIRIHGKSAHACEPHVANDALLAGSNVVCALQNIVARFLPPIDNSLVSITAFHSGNTAHNVLQSEALILGTVRCMDETMRDYVEQQIHRVIGGVCQIFGTTYELDYLRGTPTVNNDAETTKMVIDILTKAGYDVQICKPSLGSEDFAHFLNRVPGCFLYVGCGNEKIGHMFPVHNSRFDIEPEAFKIAMDCAANIYLGASTLK